MSSFVLKIFAVIFMFIDHIGFVFFPSQIIFRIIGRIAFPIFAFQIGIGFKHTKDKRKHIFTMLLFAIISQIPFRLIHDLYGILAPLNVFFTFALALSIIYCIDEIKHMVVKIPLVMIIFIIANYITVDYGILGIALTVLLYYISEVSFGSLIAITSFSATYCFLYDNTLELYCMLSIPFLLLFNGKKGANVKWLFYIFYPLHMLIFYLIFKFV